MNIKTLITRFQQPQQLIGTGHNIGLVLVKHTTRLAPFFSTALALFISSQCFAETRPMPTRQPVFNQVSIRTVDSTFKGAGVVTVSKQSGTDSIDSFIQFFSPVSTQIQPMPKPQTDQKSDQTGLKNDELSYFHILFFLMAFVIGLGIALGG